MKGMNSNNMSYDNKNYNKNYNKSNNKKNGSTGGAEKIEPLKQLPVDLHIHTIASGHAYSTMEEICRAAAAKKMEMVAFTDHGPAMPGGTHKYHFGNMRVLPERIEGVRVLSGIEANIISDDGGLDLPDFYLRLLHIVWAGLHNPCYPPGSTAENTKALLNALNNPLVDGIVHPGNPDYPIDREAVVKEAKKQNKLIELNNSSLSVRAGSRQNCSLIASLAREYDCLVAVNSDAHFAEDVGKLEGALELAREAGLEKRHIVNDSVGKVMDFISRRKALRN